MSDEQDKEALPWRILGKSVRGASHTSSDLPNQDAILWKQNKYKGLPLVMAIADGHGSEKYFRSDIGAQFAVQAAEETMKNFEKGLPNQSFSTVEAAAELPRNIVSRWRELVEQHWDHTDCTPKEWKWIKKKENADAWKAITTNPALPYGATLLTVLVTESFILYLQLGDGDILTVSSSGEVTKPIPDDERLLANETTSLCNPTAARDFRTYFQRLVDPKPALILLSTDGYSNSFRNPEGFLKVGKDIWHMIRSDGLQKVEENLEGWLTTATQRGSGDDITLGLLCRMSALTEDVKVDSPSVQPLKSVDNEEITHRAPTNEVKDGIPQPVSEKSIVSDDTPLTTRSIQDNKETIVPLHSQILKSADGQSVLPQQETHAVKDTATPQGPPHPTVMTPSQQVITVSNSKEERGDYNTISAAIKSMRSLMLRFLCDQDAISE